MSELLQTYWPLIVAALLLGLVIAWYLFSASRKTRVSGTSGDVLDEGAAPAQRNKALIDSAPAATPMPPPLPQPPRRLPPPPPRKSRQPRPLPAARTTLPASRASAPSSAAR